MPKAKAKRLATVPSDSSDEEQPRNSGQGAMTQAEKALCGSSKDFIEEKVNELVQYLLIQDQKKIPIKRQDLTKNVLKEHSKAFAVLIKHTEEKLHDIFGIRLVELEGKQKSYILVNELENEPENSHQQWPPDDNAKMGLVMVILAAIFMKDNVIMDTELFHFLKQLGVDVDITHDIFGDIKKFLQVDLVRQGYLECTRVPTIEPPNYEYRWGQRAKSETSKRHVLDFVCQIYGINDPEIWTCQWQDMLRSEVN